MNTDVMNMTIFQWSGKDNPIFRIEENTILVALCRPDEKDEKMGIINRKLWIVAIHEDYEEEDYLELSDEGLDLSEYKKDGSWYIIDDELYQQWKNRFLMSFVSF